MEEQDLLLCPVCSLYLREGISLKNHLQTHSKEKVIEALLNQNPLSANIEYSVDPISSSASQDSTLLPNVSNGNLGFHRNSVGIVPTASSFIEPSSSQASQLTQAIQCNSSTIPCINSVQFPSTSNNNVIAPSGISNAYPYHQLISNEDNNIILIPVYNVGPSSVIVPNNIVANSIVNPCVVVPSNQFVNSTPVTSADVFSASVNDNGLPQMSTDEPDDSVTESSNNAKISSDAEEEEKATDDEVANIFNRTLQEASSAKQSVEIEYSPTTPNNALYSAPDAENQLEVLEKRNNLAPSAAVSVIRVRSNLNFESESSLFQENESHEKAATDRSSAEPFSPISSPCYPVSLQAEATCDLNKCGKYSLPRGSEENMQSDAGNYDFVISNSNNAMHILPDSNESLQCDRENDQYILPNDEIPRTCSFDTKTKSDYNFLGIRNSFLSSVSVLSSVNKTMFANVDVYDSDKCKSNADQQKEDVKLSPKMEESSDIVQSNGQIAVKKETTSRNFSELESGGSSSTSPFNIQTDESMPPRGELSGQESLSGTETSLWGYQMQHRSENFKIACQNDNKENMKIELHSIISEASEDKYSVKDSNEKLISKCEFPAEKITSSNSASDKKVVQREFICVYCRTKFGSWRERVTHIADSHADEDGLTVEMLFGKRLRLKLESTEEGQEQKYDANERLASANYIICRICDKSLPTSLEFLEHLKEVHDIRKRSCVCPTCFVAFASSSDYQEHIQKVHPYECLSCGKKFYTRAGYMLHQKRHMKIKQYSCNDCDKSFVTKQKLAEHVNVHTGETPIRCEECGCQFKRYSNYQQHKKCVHLNVKRQLKELACDCGQVFHSREKLQWHREIHDKPKQCPLCVQRFVHAASLTRHLRKSHNEAYISGRMKSELVECPVCHVHCLQSSLQVHMKIHENEKPFECTECSHRFRTKWNLQLHKWTHMSPSAKPFKCKLCVKAYIHKIDFDAHMRSHNNCRPYSCNVCGRQFLRRHNCIRHMREHKEPRAFKCKTCGKLFSRSYYLTEHEKVHTGEKPHVCHVCGKASATKSNHNKHVKLHNVVRESVNVES